jgi:hypothetical protein
MTISTAHVTAFQPPRDLAPAAKVLLPFLVAMISPAMVYPW